WSEWVCVNSTASTDAQDRPTLARRDDSWRGPRPRSIRTPKPSTSTRLALPPLPLARTVKRNAIRRPFHSGILFPRHAACAPSVSRLRATYQHSREGFVVPMPARAVCASPAELDRPRGARCNGPVERHSSRTDAMESLEHPPPWLLRPLPV